MWAGGQDSTAGDEIDAYVGVGQGSNLVGLRLWQLWEAPKTS